MFSIHSVNSDRELIFSDYSGPDYQVELQGSVLNSKIFVFDYEEIARLDGFFEELAGYQKPWNGIKKWESLEGEFSISATCSRTGKITFIVEFFYQAGSEEEALVRAGLVTEFGQLGSIAREAARFFSH